MIPRREKRCDHTQSSMPKNTCTMCFVVLKGPWWWRAGIEFFAAWLWSWCHSFTRSTHGLRLVINLLCNIILCWSSMQELIHRHSFGHVLIILVATLRPEVDITGSTLGFSLGGTSINQSFNFFPNQSPFNPTQTCPPSLDQNECFRHLPWYVYILHLRRNQLDRIEIA